MKNILLKLSPSQRRNLVIGGSVAVVVGVLFFATSGDSERIKRNHRVDDVRAVLTSRDSRTVGMESLAAKQKNLERRNLELERQLDVMKRESKGSSGVFETVTELSKEIKNLQKEIRDVSKSQEKLAEKTAKSSKKTRAEKNAPTSEMERELERQVEVNRNQKKETIEEIFGQVPKVESTTEEESGRNQKNDEPAKKEALIRTVKNEEPENTDASGDDEEGAYLPIGSIITGTLINGMDAPTGQGARRDPFPATLRIQKEAILPNHFSLDVRECFMQVSGYGDMSSERAYLRGEAISCVREDGGIIEAKMDSYVIGEDGKAGVRGRLVSKEGQLLARSLMAGFLEGVAGAFNVQAAPSLRIDGGDSMPIYKQTLDADRIQGGFAGGTSNALSRLADYYMDMADSIFPVIEIDAGRQLDVVITRGTALKIKSK